MKASVLEPGSWAVEQVHRSLKTASVGAGSWAEAPGLRSSTRVSEEAAGSWAAVLVPHSWRRVAAVSGPELRSWRRGEEVGEVAGNWAVGLERRSSTTVVVAAARVLRSSKTAFGVAANTYVFKQLTKP
ncbi:DExH-box ATP-dependent RNA helicase DExH5, mitochondrial [Frankliniella fusca]|uniref:DExH-box ATP-dependent RNA helicase DExH5, mitochondrial n=1 Tax=Frankliniella fusca TaxID=407009 RepID=A0AAE1LN49_9NEOP|nr:DExH-box ATP-dependent RNA helicase DExH5, mitochondrial [Frankliniella fusca]